MSTRIKAPLGTLALIILLAGFTGSERALEQPHPVAGTWDYTLESPQGVYKGTLVFTETEDGLRGTIESDEQSAETSLQNVAFEGSTLSFSFENPEAGTLKAKVEVEGDAFDGTMEAPMYGIEMPFTGSRTSAPEPATSETATSETATSETATSETATSETEAMGTSEALNADSKLQALFASEKAKAVLEDHLPGITTHPEIDQAMDMTLREAIEYAPNEVLEAVIAAINTDLQQTEQPAEGEIETEGRTEDQGEMEAAEKGSKGLSLDTTLRNLLADEDAKAVLEKHIPEVLKHPDISQAMDLTLPEIAQYAPDALPQEVLDAINEDLAKL